ncbi:MAG TPA: DHA2 family efflux MFS transporter permease subunit [Gammaproteobacteria bacterium]|nr:DHA2 family efflux MFS transporter permease subunit [Gammaproteobacteria bacterium]
MVIQRKSLRRLITLVVMAAAVMQILDTTIVTVALPHMQGSLGANADQISWVLTSYLISSGIFMPLTGYLTDRIGQRTYLMISIVGFTIASMLCGLSMTLNEVVLFRLAQGVAGAGLVPTAQAILVNIYPAEERGQAMAIFGIGAMFGPIMGPTLGGYLTQFLSWRWTFFINLPVGLLALTGTWLFVPDTERVRRNTDWLGFALLIVAVACMQVTLDRGQQDGWFSAHLIQGTCLLSALGFLALITRNWMMGRKAIFRLSVFRDRNFASSCLILAVIMFSMYGVMELQPLMMEALLGYPASTTGLLLAPRGITSIIAMFLAGALIRRTGARPLILCGLIFVFIGTYVVTWYSPGVGPWWLGWPVAVQGFGRGFVFVALATAAFSTLPKEDSVEAAGIRQLARVIGSSVGVSLSSTVLTRESQIGWDQIGAHVNGWSEATQHFLGRFHLSPDSPESRALLEHIVGHQAHWRGMLDAFYMLAFTGLLALPLLPLIQRGVGKIHHGNLGTRSRAVVE